jgi:hypothetical protein
MQLEFWGHLPGGVRIRGPPGGTSGVSLPDSVDQVGGEIGGDSPALSPPLLSLSEKGGQWHPGINFCPQQRST